MVLQPLYARRKNRAITKPLLYKKRGPAPAGKKTGIALSRKNMLAMKFTIILIFMACFGAWGKGHGQLVNFTGKAVSIEKAFAVIKKQTGYSFFYKNADVKDANPVTLQLHNVPLQAAMVKLLEHQPLGFSIEGKTIFISKKPIARLKTAADELPAKEIIPPILIKGKVTDTAGKVVTGASVILKNKKGVGTTTNALGEFNMETEENDVLLISYVGYETQRITINAAMLAPSYNFTITLKPSTTELEQVTIEINTGYQSLKPNEINGSVSVISEQAINNTAGTNILERILNQSSGTLLNVGKKPGNPNNKTNISIRGLGTIDGPLDPLIVVDGFIYEGEIANINPNDIENVTILKDAAAASIWGARAGNGIIVITSKKGKLNQPMQVGFNASVIVETLPDLYAISQMNASDYIETEALLFKNGYFNSQITRTPFRALTPAIEVMLMEREGKISAEQALAKLAWYSKQDNRKTYLDEFYTNATTSQYSINLRGGGMRSAYFISGNYDKSLGETFMKNDKINIRVSNDFKLSDKFSINIQASYTSFSNRSGRPAFNNISTGGRTPVYITFRDENGEPIAIDRNYRAAYTDTAAMGKLLDWKYYPLTDYQNDKYKNKREELLGSVVLKYKLASFMQLDLTYQHQKQNSNQYVHANADSYSARNMVNTYSQFNYATGIVKYIVPVGGTLSTNNADISSATARTQLNINKKINIHYFNAIIGAEGRDVRSVNSSNTTLFGYGEDPLNFTNVDIVNLYPEFLTKSNTKINASPLRSEKQHRFLSFYGNFSYSFKEKYLVSGSVRKDGSNIFGANTNDRWKPLWSAGLGWTISKENFYNFPLLPQLGLKATYGYSGNLDLSKTALPIAGYGTNTITQLPYTRVITINNPNLKWEQLAQLDIKLQFATRENRLSGIISYYRKKGTDLYGDAPYDYTTWGARAELTRNVAKMEGHGFDVEIHGKILQGTLGWTADVFFNRNENKTVDYYRNSGSDLSILVNAANRISPVIGKPLYAVAAYCWGGLNSNGDPQGYVKGELSTNYTAIISEARTAGTNLVFIGRSSPLYFGNVINTIRYRELSFSFNIHYKLDYYFMKNSINYYSLVNSGDSHADYSNRWQKAGDEKTTNIPAFIYPANSSRDGFYSASEIHANRADHIRLSYLRLSYSLTVGRKAVNPKKIEVYGALQNGGILWRKNKYQLDPDYNNQVPPSKQFVMGLRANF